MLRFNLIVAFCENFGIGIKGNLPWHLKSELKYFANTTKRVRSASKRNVVIMGKHTYYGVPANKRPLAGRVNIVLSTTLKRADLPENVLLYDSLENAMRELEENNILRDEIEDVWIVGGSGVYKEAMASPRCHRLYITKINAKFDCDTFFPTIPEGFKEVQTDAETHVGMQEENGLQYEYIILEKQT